MAVGRIRFECLDGRSSNNWKRCWTDKIRDEIRSFSLESVSPIDEQFFSKKQIDSVSEGSDFNERLANLWIDCWTFPKNQNRKFQTNSSEMFLWSATFRRRSRKNDQRRSLRRSRFDAGNDGKINEKIIRWFRTNSVSHRKSIVLTNFSSEFNFSFFYGKKTSWKSKLFDATRSLLVNILRMLSSLDFDYESLFLVPNACFTRSNLNNSVFCHPYRLLGASIELERERESHRSATIQMDVSIVLSLPVCTYLYHFSVMIFL